MTVGTDRKQALAGGGKPPLASIPAAALVYTARAMQYGTSKYGRGSFHGACPQGVTPAERLLAYLDAAMRHITTTADAITRATAAGTSLTAAACVQDDESGLPHLCHALASLAIGVTIAENDDLLPVDPGAPWFEQAVVVRPT